MADSVYVYGRVRMQGLQVTPRILAELGKMNLCKIVPAVGMSLIKESFTHPSFSYHLVIQFVSLEECTRFCLTPSHGQKLQA